MKYRRRSIGQSGCCCSRGDVQRPFRVQGAKFNGAAGFGVVTFSEAARFGRARFGGDAWFRETTFCGNHEFEGATFSRTRPSAWPDGFVELAGIVWNPDGPRVPSPSPPTGLV